MFINGREAFELDGGRYAWVDTNEDLSPVDIEIFKEKFIGTQYENANFNYYHEVINNWSSAGGNKKIDWIATARGFMARDMKEGKFVDINFNPNAKRINQDRKLTYAEQQAAIRNSF